VARVIAIGAAVVVGAALVSPSGHAANVGWALLALAAFLVAMVVTRTVAPEEIAATRSLARRARLRLRGAAARREAVG
jgi:hypothetical protein